MTGFTKILHFFDEIGLAWQTTPIEEKAFLPGILINNGTLLIDQHKLVYPGDLLHEAGHIAVTEASARHQLSGDAKDWGHGGGEEMAAIAWSWAALKYIGLEPSVVFHQNGYNGASGSIIEAFEQGQGFGYPLLYSWFMCDLPGQPNGFPTMQRWLR